MVSADPPATARLIVLVHGLGLSGRYMVPTAKLLAPDYPVYVPDFPGFGDSGKPGRALDVPGLADALAAWMPDAGLDQATFLGNSFGEVDPVELVHVGSRAKDPNASSAGLSVTPVEQQIMRPSRPQHKMLRHLCREHTI